MKEHTSEMRLTTHAVMSISCVYITSKQVKRVEGTMIICWQSCTFATTDAALCLPGISAALCWFFQTGAVVSSDTWFHVFTLNQTNQYDRSVQRNQV